MHSALYFPHTEVRDPNLLRTALLLWDQLEYISPTDEYQPIYPDDTMRTIVDVIGKKRVPTESEKISVNEKIQELLRDDIPEVFRYPSDEGDHQRFRDKLYELRPEKFDYSTWSMLHEKGLTPEKDPNSNNDYPVSEAAGLTLMSILADEMAGETRARITDRKVAYATIANVLKSSQPDEREYERAIALTLKVPDVSQFNVERLIRLRSREDNHLRPVRHNYRTAIEQHLREKLATRSRSDREELERQFQEKMEDDFKDLKEELGYAKTAAFFSKDVIVMALAVAGLMYHIPALMLSGAVVPTTLGGSIVVGTKYAQERRNIMREHPMAYMYEVGD